MATRNWIGLFSQGEGDNLTNELERGYEAALLIQGIELEFYSDRKVRPELELSVPRSVQATVLRRFHTALQICRSSLSKVSLNRGQLDPQELRQLQLIETVVSRYTSKRSSSKSGMSTAPEPLPRSLLGVFDSVRRQLDPSSEESVVAGFRRRRDSTLASLRILLLLVLVPLLVQQVS
ncbi:MAG: proton extrusion protein PcxA, partial [Cyanobacteriota bacterium]|nr:proton extrusion protein PcxA [Cyanobacteriota bacterium]